jgi:uncharacterized protein YcbX
VIGAMSATVVALQRFPVKSMGGEPLPEVEIAGNGLVGDREWAVYAADGKLASGKHSRRFRRMDLVFGLTARRDGPATLVRLPDGAEVVAGHADSFDLLSTHFGAPVTVRRETDVMHQDGAALSIVGTATLSELGRHEGAGHPVDPRHLRANIVVGTEVPYDEEAWIGREVTVGGARVRVTEAIQRCRMAGIAQVGLAARPDMLRAVQVHHDLMAGVYATVLRPGLVQLGDEVRLG